MPIRIHFVLPDEFGPVKSEPGSIVQGGKFRTACGSKIGTTTERGTGEPWAVHCNACEATEDFKRLNRPKPGLVADDDRTEERKPCEDCP